MYINKSITRQKDKTYTRYLLRECYREGKKIKHRMAQNPAFRGLQSSNLDVRSFAINRGVTPRSVERLTAHF
jgi:hypothetical protein